MARWSRRLRWIVTALLVLFLAAQFVPVTRANPPVESDIPAPPDVKAILRRACYDCHSNETVWPWYSYVAPASWLVVYDVNKGRRDVNFSTWNRIKPERLSRQLRSIWLHVEHDDMPLWYYLPLHPTARLSDGDKAVIRAWTENAGK